ncbi:hypothetical protein O5472_26685, partial [Escherichia coli]|nr:hypothetical protein [Escherichia coli]
SRIIAPELRRFARKANFSGSYKGLWWAYPGTGIPHSFSNTSAGICRMVVAILCGRRWLACIAG